MEHTYAEQKAAYQQSHSNNLRLHTDEMLASSLRFQSKQVRSLVRELVKRGYEVEYHNDGIVFSDSPIFNDEEVVIYKDVTKKVFL